MRLTQGARPCFFCCIAEFNVSTTLDATDDEINYDCELQFRQRNKDTVVVCVGQRDLRVWCEFVWYVALMHVVPTRRKLLCSRKHCTTRFENNILTIECDEHTVSFACANLSYIESFIERLEGTQ